MRSHLLWETVVGGEVSIGEHTEEVGKVVTEEDVGYAAEYKLDWSYRTLGALMFNDYIISNT